MKRSWERKKGENFLLIFFPLFDHSRGTAKDGGEEKRRNEDEERNSERDKEKRREIKHDDSGCSRVK